MPSLNNETLDISQENEKLNKLRSVCRNLPAHQVVRLVLMGCVRLLTLVFDMACIDLDLAEFVWHHVVGQ